MKHQYKMATLLQLRLWLCLLLGCQTIWATSCVSEGRRCFTPIPNLDVAMQGYDPVMCNPLVAPDPGKRAQIFEPMGFLSDHTFVLNSFVANAAEYLNCDSELSGTTLRSYNEYKRERSSSQSFSIGADVSASGGVSGFSFEASAGYGREEKGKEFALRNFFHETDGEIMIQKAQCITHEVRIAPFYKPSFTNAFLAALRKLHVAAMNPDTENSKQIFRKFVASYGTHFMRTVYLGASLLYEKRFISHTEDSGSENSRAQCVENSAYGSIGAGVAGIGSASVSFALASGKCGNSSEGNAYFRKNSMSSSKIVSLGSLPTSNLDVWASTVKDSPVPIEYTLDKISNLFREQWFDTIPLHEGNVTENLNGPEMYKFFEKKSTDYCNIILRRNCSTGVNPCDTKRNCGPGIKCVSDAGSYHGYRCDVKYGGAIIAGGYDADDKRLSDVEGLDTWQLPSLPHAISRIALSVVGSRLISCGGQMNRVVDIGVFGDVNGEDECYSLDRSASSPSWIPFTSLPRAMHGHSATVVGGHIWYVHNNQLFDLNTVTTRFRSYNLPLIVTDYHCAVSNATHSYIIGAGGIKDQIWVNTVAYSPARWRKVASMARGRDHHACLWLSDSVYITGGGGIRSDVLVLNTNTGMVQETGALNYGRQSHKMMVLNGEPAVVGGYGGSLLETYNLENRKWKLSSRKLQKSIYNFGLAQLHD